MKSMGWEEGKGLGADETGIVKPIKVNVQTDQRGLGFTYEDSIQLKNQWWADAYNAGSKKLKTDYIVTSVGVIVKTKKKKSKEKDSDKDIIDDDDLEDTVYNNNFVSKGYIESNVESEVVDTKKNKSKKRKSSKDEELVEEPIQELVEDKVSKQMIDFNKVFKKAKNLTCHKAARHGINMSGKMNRIAEQEKEYLKSLGKQ